MLNDNEIIQNTRIVPGDGCVEMRIHLPGDQGEYVQKAQNVESAQKHIITWCENVRAHLDMLRQEREDEQADAKRRRKSGVTPPPAPPSADPSDLPPPPPIGTDPLSGLEGWLEAAKSRLRDTNETISELAKESNSLKDKIAQYEQVLELIGDPNELPAKTDAMRTGDTEEETDDREEAERVRDTGAQES
jgi:hypothetical protein